MRPPNPGRGTATVLLAVVASLALPLTAHAAAATTAPVAAVASPAGSAPLQPVGSAPAAAGTASGTSTLLATSKVLNISMQAQQKSNWCWDAAGNTVAAFYGRYYSQNDFCTMAFNRVWGTVCPNDQATLAHDQQAYYRMGIAPGRYLYDYLRYTTVQTEINANRPVMTRIQWKSGGGHMMLIYGYDTSRQWVYWGNPWGSSPRYNWGSWSYYVNNASFSWTHSLYQIGA